MKRMFLLGLVLSGVVAVRAQTNQTVAAKPTPTTNDVTTPKTYSETPDYQALSKKLDEVRSVNAGSQVDVVKARPDILYTKRADYSGLLVHLIKTPKSGNLLQLFNPFAPPEYDTQRPPNEFNSTMLSARSLPHAFTDERNHEPVGFTFVSVGFQSR